MSKFCTQNYSKVADFFEMIAKNGHLWNRQALSSMEPVDPVLTQALHFMFHSYLLADLSKQWRRNILRTWDRILAMFWRNTFWVLGWKGSFDLFESFGFWKILIEYLKLIKSNTLIYFREIRRKLGFPQRLELWKWDFLVS